MIPRGPQKWQKSILMVSLVVLDPNASPTKISVIFGTGCHKVCMYQPIEVKTSFRLFLELCTTDISFNESSYCYFAKL